ncbi:hypothetical protein BST61_g1461 [Cercospora zeina]
MLLLVARMHEEDCARKDAVTFIATLDPNLPSPTTPQESIYINKSTIPKMLRQYLTIVLATIVAAAMVNASCRLTNGQCVGVSQQSCRDFRGSWSDTPCPS